MLEGGRYGWIKRLFGKYFQLVKFERIDIEPTKELLAPHGFVRGVAIWIPFRRTDIPPGWKKLAVGTHFTRTGFTRLVTEYYKKWNERSRRARKKFLAFGDELRIELVDEDTFAAAFKQTKVKHMFKTDYIKYYRAMMASGRDSIRSYVCYRGDEVLAGLAVHDYYGGKQDSTDAPHAPNATVHMSAFTGKNAKPYQAGTGLIDRWFADSLEKGLTYINFDHLRDSSMTSDQQGYTDFKLNFMDSECYFRDSYFRFL